MTLLADFAIPTERLILRAWRDEDHAPLLALCSDPHVMEHLGPLQMAADIDAALARQRGFQRDHGHCFWAVERREDGAMLGFCGLKIGPDDTPIEQKIEIGWRLRVDAWGQGYAREAAQASIDWGWANLSDDEILAMTVLGNTRSWGLMERLGMARVHALDFDHPAVSVGDPLRPHIVYAIGRPR